MYIFLIIFSDLNLFFLIFLSVIIYLLSLLALRGYENAEIEFVKAAYSKVCLNTKALICGGTKK